MSLINNAIIYRATLPALSEVATGLQEQAFTECQPWEARSAGFVPVDPVEHPGELTCPFAGGFALAVRIDAKVVPGGAVRAEVDKRCDRIKDEQGRRVGKKERAGIKDDVLQEFCAKAFVSTKIVRVFYHEEQKLLIVAGSQAQANTAVTWLLKACSAIKTETIHVNDVKQGLTTRLKEYVDPCVTGVEDRPYPFDDFSLAGFVELKNGKHKVSFKVEDLRQNIDALRETMARDFAVASIGLSTESGGSFRLNDKLQVKSIKVPEDSTEQIETWSQGAAFEVTNLVGITNALCALFGFPKAEGFTL